MHTHERHRIVLPYAEILHQQLEQQQNPYAIQFALNPRTGLQEDYNNDIFAVTISVATYKINPSEETRALIQRAGAQLRTYTQYWQDNIAALNTYANTTGTQPLATEHILSIFVTRLPTAAQLDTLATELKQLTTSTLLDSESLEDILRTAQQAKTILRGKPMQKNN